MHFGRFLPLNSSFVREIGFKRSIGISTTVYVSSVVLGMGIQPVVPAIDSPSSQPAHFPSVIDVALVNSQVLLILAIGGFLLGVPTILSLVVNGFGFGSIVAAIHETGSLRAVILTTGAHGLFELPAIWIAGAIGISIAGNVVSYCCGRIDRLFPSQLVHAWLKLLGIAIGFVIIGAVIETNVTPWLVTNVLQK